MEGEGTKSRRKEVENEIDKDKAEDIWVSKPTPSPFLEGREYSSPPYSVL